MGWDLNKSVSLYTQREKCPNSEFLLVHILQICVFSANALKYGPEIMFSCSFNSLRSEILRNAYLFCITY